MEQQPTSLVSKASGTATSAIPLTKDATPWPNTVPASTNLFVTRSWLIPPNENKIPAPAIITMERPHAESAPPKQAGIPCPMVLDNSAPYNNNTSLANVTSEELCRWGPQCPICAQSAPNLKIEDSDWEEGDWNGDIQKAKEEEKQKKEDKLRRKLAAEQCTNNYYPPSPQHNPFYRVQDGPSHHYKTKAEE